MNQLWFPCFKIQKKQAVDELNIRRETYTVILQKGKYVGIDETVQVKRVRR